MEERLCRVLARFSQGLAAIALSMAVGVAVGQRTEDAETAMPLLAQAENLRARASLLVGACPQLKGSVLEVIGGQTVCGSEDRRCLHSHVARLGAEIRRCESLLQQAALHREKAAYLGPLFRASAEAF